MRIVTLTGAGCSVVAGLPTMVALGKELVSNEVLSNKLSNYHLEVLKREQIDDPGLYSRIIMGDLKHTGWTGKDVEVLLQGLKRLMHDSPFKSPSPPQSIEYPSETKPDQLLDLARRLLALGSLHRFDHSNEWRFETAKKWTPSPFKSNKKEFASQIEDFFRSSPDPSRDLLLATLHHISVWHLVQNTFPLSSYRIDTWLAQQLDFPRELNDLVGIPTDQSYLDVFLNPATATVIADMLIYRATDLLTLDRYNLFKRVLNAAPIYLKWHKIVKAADRDSPVRLYTTNWDCIPELVAGIWGWRTYDGFVRPDKHLPRIQTAEDAPALNYSIADPVAFKRSVPSTDIEIVKLHGGIDWYTNGLWVFRTRPAHQLASLGSLIGNKIGFLIPSQAAAQFESVDPDHQLTRLLYTPVSYANDLVTSNALIHPTDAKGFPVYEPMRSYALALSDDLLAADVFWVIGHSLSDAYFTQIISDGLRSNPKLRVLIQDPYPSQAAVDLTKHHERISIVAASFGDFSAMETLAASIVAREV